MKKVLLLLLLVSFGINAQTTIDLSGMTDDVTLGQNCSNSQEQVQYITTGDVNLNGNELDLRNVDLIITGNLNGPGEIEGCGNSNVCVNGVIQNEIDIDDVTQNCSTLSVNTFDLSNNFPLDVRYEVYDVQGKLIDRGRTNSNTVSNLPRKRIIFLSLDGYLVRQLYINK